MAFNTDGRTESHVHSFDGLIDTGAASSTSSGSSGNGKETSMTVSALLAQTYTLPPPLYPLHPIGLCTRCDALTNDADSLLTPIQPPVGFRKVHIVLIVQLVYNLGHYIVFIVCCALYLCEYGCRVFGNRASIVYGRKHVLIFTTTTTTVHR